LGNFEHAGVNTSTKGSTSHLLSKIDSSFIDKVKGFNINYSDAGLFGVYLAGTSKTVGQGIKVAHKELIEISKNGVSDKLFNRGKNKTIFGLVSSLETNVGLNEFIMHNSNINFKETIQNLQNLTKDDVQRAAKSVLESRPTIVSYGNLEYVPSVYDL